MGRARIVAGAIAAGAVVAGSVAFVAPAAVAGPTGGALPPELVQIIDVAGHHGVPDDAAMVAANVTAVAPAGPGHFTVYPCDADVVPDSSNLNYLPDDTVPNLTLTRIADDGTICIATHAVADVVVDIIGYVPAGSSIVALPEPTRFRDTRRETGKAIGGDTLVVDVTGHPDVDDGATVVMFNLTSVAAEAPGHATVHPCDAAAVPGTSSLNYAPGRTVANFVTSRIGTDGTICITPLTTTHLVVDVVAAATDGITPLPEPIRIRDTRTWPDKPLAGTTQTVAIDDHVDLPTTATAVLYNLTAVLAEAPGHATSHPCDRPRPHASNLNYVPGRAVANGTITKLATDDTICIHTHATAHYVIDLIAYTTDEAHYTPLPNPVRAHDSRTGWRSTCDWIIADTSWVANEDEWIEVVNITTHERRRLQTSVQQFAGVPIINADCDAVLWYRGNLGVVTIPLDGSAITSSGPNPEPQLVSRKGLYQAGDRFLIAGNFGALYDAATGDQVFTPPQDATTLIDVTADLLVAVVIELENLERYAWEVWHAPTNTRISRFEPPWPEHHVGRPSISPDGKYVAASVQIRPLDGGAFEYATIVTTIYGDVVDVIPSPVSTSARFLGNGELAVCANWNGLYRWQLFGPLTKIVDWPTWQSRYESCSQFTN